MKKILLGCLLVGSANLWSQENSEVKIPLTKYLELVEKQKTQPLTVVEEVTLKGDYKTSNFQITFSGQAVAPWKKEVVLDNFDGHLRNCSGSALISFENNRYHLTPQKSSYQISCRLQPKNRNLRLSITNALFFESQVANAETNVNDDNPSMRQVSLIEKARDSEQRPRADVVAKAQYKLSILPDTSKFEYQFSINNPNRLSEKYSLSWINQEIIESIGTDLKYQEAGNAVSFTVPTGEHQVVVRGKINGQAFKPLLKSEEQYLLIQNHPLMQVQPTTNWRRIATSESSIQQEYNSARAFLIDPRESLAWSAKKLDVFSALGYTLKNAHYLYYVPRDGKAVIEATYQVSNQGTPEIALNIPGQALYMSVDGAVSPLYKDDKGNLLVSLSSGEHTIVVQYQPTGHERTLATVVGENLVKPHAVISQSSLTLRHDPAWKMIVGRYGDDFVSQIRLAQILQALMYAALFFFLLRRLYGFENRRVLRLSTALVGLLSLFGGVYTSLLTLLAIGLIVWRYRSSLVKFFKKMTQTEFSYKKIFLSLGVFVVVMYCATAFMQGFSRMGQRNYGNSSKQLGQVSEDMVNESESYPASAPAIGNLASNILSKAKKEYGEADGMVARGGAGGAMPSEGRGAGENYEGLPAKIEIPSDGENVYFNLSLVGADKDIKMSSFLVKNYFFMLADLLLLAALGWVLYKNRKQFKDTLLKSYS